jgi:hypothetical protein
VAPRGTPGAVAIRLSARLPGRLLRCVLHDKGTNAGPSPATELQKCKECSDSREIVHPHVLAVLWLAGLATALVQGPGPHQQLRQRLCKQAGAALLQRSTTQEPRLGGTYIER